MQSKELNLQYKVLRTCKKDYQIKDANGSIDYENESEDQYEIDAEKGLFALSDGVGSSYRAKSWAKCLVKEWVANPAQSKSSWEIDYWVRRAIEVYKKDEPKYSDVPSFTQVNYRRGGGATFLGVRIEYEKTWIAKIQALGDTNIFKVAIEKNGTYTLKLSFPIKKSDQFTAFPDILRNRSEINHLIDLGFKEKTEEISSDVMLLMCTDAVAKFLLRWWEDHSDQGFSQKIQEILNFNAAEWNEFIEKLRGPVQNGDIDIENDDSTIIAITFKEKTLQDWESATLNINKISQCKKEWKMTRQGDMDKAIKGSDFVQVACVYGDGSFFQEKKDIEKQAQKGKDAAAFVFRFKNLLEKAFNSGYSPEAMKTLEEFVKTIPQDIINEPRIQGIWNAGYQQAKDEAEKQKIKAAERQQSPLTNVNPTKPPQRRQSRKETIQYSQLIMNQDLPNFPTEIKGGKLCELEESAVDKREIHKIFHYGTKTNILKYFVGGTYYSIRFFVKKPYRSLPDYKTIKEHLNINYDNQQNSVFAHFGYYFEDLWGCGVPVMILKWVKGMPIGQYLDIYKHYESSLKSLLDDWDKKMIAMQSGNIAHGNINNHHIIVDNSSYPIAHNPTFRLVDLDNVYLPKLSNQQLYYPGHSDFQHPEQCDKPVYNEKMDYFPSIVVYVALKAISIQPSLWDQYKEYDRYDEITPSLLFRQQDFKDPNSSELFRELEKFPQLKSMVEQLKKICKGPYSNVPKLSKFLQDCGEKTNY